VTASKKDTAEKSPHVIDEDDDEEDTAYNDSSKLPFFMLYVRLCLLDSPRVCVPGQESLPCSKLMTYPKTYVSVEQKWS